MFLTFQRQLPIKSFFIFLICFSGGLKERDLGHSFHVHPSTVKGLIGITPHGAVTFVSQLYARLVNDKEMFKESGITKTLAEDVAVMVGKGSLITDCVKCNMYCPPFLSKTKQMPEHQVKRNRP